MLTQVSRAWSALEGHTLAGLDPAECAEPARLLTKVEEILYSQTPDWELSYGSSDGWLCSGRAVGDREAGLLEEIRDLGYTGSLNLLYKYINQGRLEGDRITPSPRRLLDHYPPRKPARQGPYPSR